MIDKTSRKLGTILALTRSFTALASPTVAEYVKEATIWSCEHLGNGVTMRNWLAKMAHSRTYVMSVLCLLNCATLIA